MHRSRSSSPKADGQHLEPSRTSPRRAGQRRPADHVCRPRTSIGIARSVRRYRDTDLRAVIEHYRRTQPGGTIAAITGELDLLRIAVQTLATVVRITTPQVRQLARGGLLHSAITPPKS